MSKKDTEKVFRNLVNNIYMSDFDYLETKFSFDTVFYKDLYSYCMCKCGYEHELFDYITPTTGKINQEKFERVLKCIVDGKCPHTSQVPREYIKEVVVHGLHVAAAVGTIEAIENTQLHEDDDCYRITGLFWLDPCLVAVLKNSKAAYHPKIWEFIGGWEYFSNVELTFYMTVGKEAGKIDVNGATPMTIREISILIFLAEQRNIPLLKIYMDKQVFDRYFLQALQVAWELKFDDVIDTLLNHRDWMESRVMFGGLSEDDEEPYRSDSLEMIELRCTNAIVNSHQSKFIDQILQELLNQIKSNYFSNKPIVCDMLRRLSTVCDAFQLPEMKKIVLKHYHTLTQYDTSSDIPTSSKPDQVKVLFKLLYERCMMGKGKIISCLKLMSTEKVNLPAIRNNREIADEISHSALFNNPDSLIAILDFGLDINTVVIEGRTFFTCLLETLSESPYPVYRQVLELVVLHNPDLSKHKSAISYVLKADMTLYELTLTVEKYEATHDRFNTCDDKELYKAYGGSLDNNMQNMGYVMDAKLHGRFGHDDENSCFNFLVPFLIECGFHVSTDDRAVLDSLTDGLLHDEGLLLDFEEPKLQSEELKFIKHFLQTPRSLKQGCRTALRRHYVGSQIHKFVNLVAMPLQVKDYILLKPMMKSLNSELIS